MLPKVAKTTRRKHPGGRPRKAVTKEDNVHIRLEAELGKRLDAAIARELLTNNQDYSRSEFFRWLLRQYLSKHGL